ncbi:MAG: D-alanyl-D-alanine carboxypeptidase family protein [Acidobacteria bacterium]|nr:D-alanyl-D-alanine carboxypeptidase family protein [Acidobacteriota bacterium]
MKLDESPEMNAKLDTYMTWAATKLIFDFDVYCVVMFKIPNKFRRLAALRGYLRFQAAGKDFDDVWAWSSDEIKAFKGSEEQKTAKAFIDKVRSAFDARSEMSAKSYKLVARAKPRSLEEQIKLWNNNGSAKTIGKKLWDFVDNKLAEYPDTPDLPSVESFVKMITEEAKNLPAATNATPGLSAHGHLKAIDFHVTQNGNKVLHSGGADYWRSTGADDALKAAVTTVNNNSGRKVFDGPLKSPDEPWHYSYIPAEA